MAPVDVARAMEPPVVIAVDPGQPSGASEINNGVQAVMRAMEICHQKHAELRVGAADVVIRPEFRRYIDTLDFGGRRECVAAGLRAARGSLVGVRELLAGVAETPEGRQQSSDTPTHRC